MPSILVSTGGISGSGVVYPRGSDNAARAVRKPGTPSSAVSPLPVRDCGGSVGGDNLADVILLAVSRPAGTGGRCSFGQQVVICTRRGVGRQGKGNCRRGVGGILELRGCIRTLCAAGVGGVQEKSERPTRRCARTANRLLRDNGNAGRGRHRRRQ